MIDLGRETDGNNEICLGVRFASCTLKLYDSLVLSTVLEQWSPAFFLLHSLIKILQTEEELNEEFSVRWL